MLLAAYSKMQAERDKLKERLKKEQGPSGFKNPQPLHMTNKHVIIKKWLSGEAEVQDVSRKTWPHIDLIWCLRELFSHTIGLLRNFRVNSLSNLSRSPS